ncbi:hypothetical protein [Achromobacter anxifer]|uniref:hypothetical protein n=1 Tax=Achromobacter anxifer TaxID=1287737 RepID=UPI0015917D0A|nr:hypothetical protein [Achromobacter anxifer]MDF8361079.1 hypothetical protein [Achromobacter anxifer]
MPDAEVKHLAPKRRSRLPLALLLLLLTGAAGAVLYSVFDAPALPVVAESGAPAAQAQQPAASAPAPVAVARAPEAEAPPSAAAIIEDHPLAQLTRPDADADRVPENPLSALAVTAAPPQPRAALQAQTQAPAPAAAPKAGGPAAQHAEHAANSARAAASRAAPKGGKTPSNDSDAALLAALMSYGLPPASPPGTKVYKNDGVFVRELPGSPLTARLEQCRKLGFLESEQCRLRVCSGYWGTAPECPNPQANVEP